LDHVAELGLHRMWFMPPRRRSVERRDLGAAREIAVRPVVTCTPRNVDIKPRGRTRGQCFVAAAEQLSSMLKQRASGQEQARDGTKVVQSSACHIGAVDFDRRSHYVRADRGSARHGDQRIAQKAAIVSARGHGEEQRTFGLSAASDREVVPSQNGKGRRRGRRSFPWCGPFRAVGRAGSDWGSTSQLAIASSRRAGCGCCRLFDVTL